MGRNVHIKLVGSICIKNAYSTITIVNSVSTINKQHQQSRSDASQNTGNLQSNLKIGQITEIDPLRPAAPAIAFFATPTMKINDFASWIQCFKSNFCMRLQIRILSRLEASKGQNMCMVGVLFALVDKHLYQNFQ